MIERLPGSGWIALVGGGEFSFGETEDADAAWFSKLGEGAVGFLPTASGSAEYGDHFGDYLEGVFGRRADTIPVYRERDARRVRNVERIDGLEALYVGGGVADELLAVLTDSPCLEAMGRILARGGVVAAVAAAAQAFGVAVRSLRGRDVLDGFGWLPGTVIEANFDPAHDRRLRETLRSPRARRGVGLPAGSAILLGPEGAVETVGIHFELDDAEGTLVPCGAP